VGNVAWFIRMLSRALAVQFKQLKLLNTARQCHP